MRKTAIIILLLCVAGYLKTEAQRVSKQKPKKEITTHVTDSLIRDIERKRLIDNKSVDYVSEERMNKGLVTNSLSALSGQAAGVQVTADSRMAAPSSVRVRARHSPEATTLWSSSTVCRAVSPPCQASTLPT